MATDNLLAATATRPPSRHDLEGLQTLRADRSFVLVQSLLALSLLGAPLAFGAVQTWCWALLVGSLFSPTEANRAGLVASFRPGRAVSGARRIPIPLRPHSRFRVNPKRLTGAHRGPDLLLSGR